jgi:hypothetical protein
LANDVTGFAKSYDLVIVLLVVTLFLQDSSNGFVFGNGFKVVLFLFYFHTIIRIFEQLTFKKMDLLRFKIKILQFGAFYTIVRYEIFLDRREKTDFQK